MPIVLEGPDTLGTSLYLEGDTLICFTADEWNAIQYGLIGWTAMSQLATIRLDIIEQQDSLITKYIDQSITCDSIIQQEQFKSDELTFGLRRSNARLAVSESKLAKIEKRRNTWRVVALMSITFNLIGIALGAALIK